MVQNSLVRYIREQIRAGYDIRTIKDYLLRYGYAESVLNEAIQAAYPPAKIKHVIHFSRTSVALIVAVLCSLILVGAGLFMFLTPQSKLLDVQIDLVSDSVEFGKDLMFNTELFNLGKARNYDVLLRYEVYNLKDELVKFEEETIGVETRASSSVSIGLEGIEPGNYYLRTTAFYDDKTAKATASFRIVKKEIPKEAPIERIEPGEECPISCNDGDDCTNDYCTEATGYKCRHDRIYPCCGNGICENNENYENCLADCNVPKDRGDDIFGDKPIWEKIDMIKDIGGNDKDKAIEYCKGIEQTSYRYDCFSKVAISSNDENICENIEEQSYKDSCYKDFATENKNSEICADIVKDSKRDQCYMDFATSGDYSVCDKLVNKYLKQSCESLKKLSEVQVS